MKRSRAATEAGRASRLPFFPRPQGRADETSALRYGGQDCAVRGLKARNMTICLTDKH